MTRTYINKHGERIEVSQEHLDTAIAIKLELQKASPSMRTNWGQHRKMMIKEGFEDSCTCEAYRCLIKSEQKKRGDLPSATTYAEIVSENKLESIKEAVGEMAYKKREIQNEARKLGKIKRDVIDTSLFIDETTKAVENALRDIDFDRFHSPTHYESKAPIRGTRMILAISDWHIGALVDVEGNKYNLDIAKARIGRLLSETINTGRMNGVKHVDVVALGDFVEGVYMRSSQAYGVEFPASEQIAEAGKLIIEMLTSLSKHFSVTYSGISGNHDRMNQADKTGNLEGDSAMVIINHMVKMFVDTAKLKGLKYRRAYHHYHDRLLGVNGRNFRFEHGDLLAKNDTKKLANRSSSDGVQYDVIVYGHFHHYSILEVGVNKFEVRVGSSKGSDDYSEKLGLGSAPSQALILVDINGEIDFKRISLK